MCLTTDQWIAVIPGIATFILALLAYRTLREMQRQRDLEYLPSFAIVCKDHSVIYNLAMSKNERDIIWVEYVIDAKKVKGVANSAAFDLFNIGKGIAKDIELEWIFDRSTFMSIIDGYDTNSRISTKQISGSDRLVYILDGKVEMADASIKNNLAFLKPNSLSNEATQIDIPFELKIFLEEIFYIFFQQKNPNPLFELSKKIRIELSIKYKNTFGKKYQDRYTGIFNWIYFDVQNDFDFSIGISLKLEQIGKK